MSGSSVLIKRVGWNFIGVLIPTIFAIPAIGYLARVLGVEDFGLFILVYALIGYTSVFDVGLSRAVIREVAFYQDEPKKIEKIIGTSTVFLLIIGSIVTAIFFLGVTALVNLLDVSNAKHANAVAGMKIFGFAIIPFLLSTVWLSYLEGRGDFEKLNKLKTAIGILMVALPVAFVSISSDFEYAILGVLVARIISLLICYYYSVRKFGAKIFSFSAGTLRQMVAFGGWVTVSNVVSPVMVYFDRFILSNMVGAKLVAFYTAPAELVSRMSFVPTSISRVIFQNISSNDKALSTKVLYKIMILISACLSMFVFIASDFILEIWLGFEYVSSSSNILKILTVGFFFNSLAQMPFAKIQALGNSRLTAFIHISELVPYLLLLYFCILKFELLGAAIAWTVRVTVDYFIMEFFSRKLESCCV
ncbi:flippase [Stutzerimonas nitrititolerans]|uniref:flippase n=1 Tax=Stutzerimonas nitrititolerans TaxID=2482751 RepID=UPI00289AA40A|nr:flippase [Stutzerimonas nitrititolerans]